MQAFRHRSFKTSEKHWFFHETTDTEKFTCTHLKAAIRGKVTAGSRRDRSLENFNDSGANYQHMDGLSESPSIDIHVAD